MLPNESMMREAIALARKAHAKGEYPIGAVVAIDDTIIGAAYTALDSNPDPTAHGEILAIRAAARHLRKRYMEGAVLYSTLEPCPMCTSAAIWAKCAGIVFGATQEDALRVGQQMGASKTFRQIRVKSRVIVVHGIPNIEIIEGFLRRECLELLRLG
jgi:tRNA(Arg) A34 adenosine deaminase TadA